MRMFSFIISVFLIFSCSKETPAVNIDDDPQTVFEWKTEDLIPIVMVHGMLASGDTYSQPAMLFLSNKYPKDYLYAYDWNTTAANNSVAIQQLDVFINDILVKTGRSQVVLIGHSAGGGLSYSYCANSSYSSKVAKYIHIGSNPQSKPAGPSGNIPTLNIYSKGDLIVQGNDIPDAQNIVFEDLDHYEVATSKESFWAIFNFIFPEIELLNKEIQPTARPKISGRIVSLGENKPEAAIKVTMYYIQKETAERKNIGINIEVDNLGYFKDLEVDPDEYTEFVLESGRTGFRTLHYFREPFKADNPFVYLRVFPPQSSLAGILLSSLPKSDDQSVIAVFSANRAIIHQRDELDVQGIQLANEALCSPSNSTIALFLYDNGNKTSTAAPHPIFGFVPFLKGADIFIDTAEPKPIQIEYNKRKLTVKNYKSDSEGVVIAVFE